MANEIFTVAQVTQYLQVCEKMVRKLIGENNLVASYAGNENRLLYIKKRIMIAIWLKIQISRKDLL